MLDQEDDRGADSAAASGTALRIPAFRWLWLNQLSFFLVNNALRFLYGWVVLDGLGRDESSQGLVVFALGLPMAVLLLPAGVWADRVNRRLLLMGTQTAFGLVMAVTAWLLATDRVTFGVLLLSAVVAGAAAAVGSPVRVSLVPEVLPKNLLLSGIAFGALAITMSLVAGPVTAQFFGDRFGFDGAFWYMAALCVLGVFAIFRLRLPSDASDASDAGDATPADTPSAGMWVSLLEGLRFVGTHRALRTLFVLLGVGGLIMTPLMFVTLQALVKEDVARDAGDAAPLFALMGVGIAASSIYVMRKGDLPNKGRLFTRAMLGGTTCLVLMGLSTSYQQLMVLSFFMGMCGGFFINMNQSLVQANTPMPLMGRVMGLYTLVQTGLTPFGALGLGILASGIGVGPTMVAGGIVGFLIVLLVHTKGKALRGL